MGVDLRAAFYLGQKSSNYKQVLAVAFNFLPIYLLLLLKEIQSE